MAEYTMAEVLKRYPSNESTQYVLWHPARWMTAELRDWKTLIEALADKSSEEPGKTRITRGAVRDYTNAADPRHLLIPAMVWGFGTIPYGPYRTAMMLRGGRTSLSTRDELDLIRQAARKSPKVGFAALFANRRAKLPYLGTAFGTKYLHFAAGDQCLIYDARVHATLARLRDWPSSIPTHPTGLSSSDYLQWCTGAVEAASAHGCQPVDIEYALFCANGNDLD